MDNGNGALVCSPPKDVTPEEGDAGDEGAEEVVEEATEEGAEEATEEATEEASTKNTSRCMRLPQLPSLFCTVLRPT